MSLTIPQASQSGLFKPGYNSYDAEDGAVIRNVGTPPAFMFPFHHD
jgi:T-complex protein 1 subunit theta